MHDLQVENGRSMAEFIHWFRGSYAVIFLAIGLLLLHKMDRFQSGNHNDLYQILPQFSGMIKSLNRCEIAVQNSILNADKCFDIKTLRRACRRRNIEPNIKKNIRNRKHPKRDRKRFFNEKIYKKRFVNERFFAWLDSLKPCLCALTS